MPQWSRHTDGAASMFWMMTISRGIIGFGVGGVLMPLYYMPPATDSLFKESIRRRRLPHQKLRMSMPSRDVARSSSSSRIFLYHSEPRLPSLYFS